MAYETYTTEALICGRMPRGEHDATLRLYTKDAGMVFARAGGVRALESKLRYGLQNFSYSRVSLVHGRHEWRVTGASALENFYYATPSRAHRAALKTAFRSLQRFLPGAVPEPDLFALVLDGVRVLAAEEYEEATYDLFLFRLLNRLGYVSLQPPYTALTDAHHLKDACAQYRKLPHAHDIVIKAVAAAQTASHL